MATLLPSMSSDEEDNIVSESRDKNIEDSDDEVDGDFEFGGVLGEDGWSRPKGWSYQTALDLLELNDSQGAGQKIPRMDIANIIAAKRRDIKSAAAKKVTDDDEEMDDDDEEMDDNGDSSSSEDDEDGEDKDVNDEGSENSDSDESDSEDDQVDQDEQQRSLAEDTLKLRAGNDEDDNDHDEDDEALVANKKEAEKVAAYFDTHKVTSTDSIEVFAQLTLSRPFLRGVAAMGFTKPTPVQAAVIPAALAGRDICASAQTGSGKTAAFLLPVLERIYQRSSGGIKCIILTPTRELAAQCLGMVVTLAQYSNLRASLIVGGAKNVQSQASELRTGPDIVVATPGRLLDHITNSAGVTLEAVEFLVLDECDRLLQLGFQEEVHEIVKACPSERQTLLFSATLNTNVDELVKLSLKRPVRFKISGKQESNSTEVEVAERLEQEFVRVRTGNEGINREGMLLGLLTRTYVSRTIVFFDTKAQAHRMMILCGLCGIKCAELHGNLTQLQRLTALEEFRKGDVDILLATDLAARGLDIDRVHSVINFEMPSQVETYVHRIGRTARRGRAGKSCTLIGEGRRHLMKDVIKDAEEKVKRSSGDASKGIGQSGIIRSRTIPQGVVAHFVAKIKSLESHVEEVYQAEAIAKMDRLAEMEVMKAQNLIEHAEEIKSRPQREWFASNQQKSLTKEAMSEKARLIAEKVGTGTHRMTRKKRRAREAKEDLLRAQTEQKEEAEEKGVRAKKPVTDKVIKTTARAAKRESQRQQINERETSVDDDDRRLIKKQNAKTKRKGAFASDSLGDSALFEEERVAFSKKAKGGEEARPSTYSFRGFDPSKDGTKVKKRGVQKFKSKSKYKRRK
ncbi:DEAD box helicase-like protein [Fragilaria crotonensis]|nr:DEAD box helicase-like protein [Fragilaria crotonensis]